MDALNVQIVLKSRWINFARIEELDDFLVAVLQAKTLPSGRDSPQRYAPEIVAADALNEL